MAYTIPPLLLQLQAAMERRQQNDDKFRQRMFAEFWDTMEGIFGEKQLPVFVPSAVMLATQERIPMMPWKNLAHRMEPEEESQWLAKMGEALSQGGCIQVKLGGNSFSLCVLDVDDDALVGPLLQANPQLRETLQTRGSKGRHFWFYASAKFPYEDYPRKKRQIVCQGKIIEFLTDGNLCTIWGTHYKTGEQYQIINAAKPIVYPFDEWRKILLSRASLVATRSDEARTQLASAGVEFLSKDWNDVHTCLEQQNPADFLIQVKLTGWVNKDYQTFILPHITLGKTTETYFNPGLESVEYGISGTLEEWKERVAMLAVGNKWLLFSLSVGLLGPLLEPLNLAGFGGHLWGDSSMGKSTLLRVAASDWGKPEYLKTWRTTSNGLEIACAKRSGTLLILDEAEEATPETVAASLYMIANGRGKSRMQKDITERPTFNWRVCALSSGERTLEVQIESGHNNGSYKVGQEMRMVPFDPTHSKHGVFDELHGHESGAKFSQHLSRESARVYGNAGIMFIERLIAQGVVSLHERLNSEQITLEEGLNPSPQEGRVARNLAAVVLAGELAVEFGIFPFDAGMVRTAMRAIFESWLPPRATGGGVGKNNEHNAIINDIRWRKVPTLKWRKLRSISRQCAMHWTCPTKAKKTKP